MVSEVYSVAFADDKMEFIMYAEMIAIGARTDIAFHPRMNAKSLIEIVKDLEPDLVITDMEMPNPYDGIDAIRGIRRNGYRGPLIAMSANNLQKISEEAGATDFIAKGKDFPSELIGILNRYIPHRRKELPKKENRVLNLQANYL